MNQLRGIVSHAAVAEALVGPVAEDRQEDLACGGHKVREAYGERDVVACGTPKHAPR